MKIDCTTCKYGYEDERLGIPMCHHPKRLSEDCVDFNMHEEKEIETEQSCSSEIPNCLNKLADYARRQVEELLPVIKKYNNYSEEQIEELRTHLMAMFLEGAGWQKKQMLKEYVRKDSLWKPTPEQLEAMECAIIDYEEDGCNTIAGYLKEIYSQIKKL